MIVSLADLKSHLRVGGDDFDADIQSYADAAEARVRNWIGRAVYAVGDPLPDTDSPDYDPYQMVADGAIIVAIKMLVFHMFWNRGGNDGTQNDAVPPQGVRDLLSGYRIFYRSEV
ncbi:head-tail connector protein [Paracoccus onubensis]|uniref:Phage gp6-like head-tail connector protein n=1 Tax=Paracoccus onubensis TaxID=1675788 RepID=A0A418T449_9RHOB|nr:head-tail connector protein [Paracoccus onubensis]RJE87964.1 phage gp6-like head-tail connector protein [Paracoccus onubensis]